MNIPLNTIRKTVRKPLPRTRETGFNKPDPVDIFEEKFGKYQPWSRPNNLRLIDSNPDPNTPSWTQKEHDPPSVRSQALKNWNNYPTERPFGIPAESGRAEEAGEPGIPVAQSIKDTTSREAAAGIGVAAVTAKFAANQYLQSQQVSSNTKVIPTLEDQFKQTQNKVSTLTGIADTVGTIAGAALLFL